MSIKTVLISYLLTFIVFLAVDMLWLGVVAKNLYSRYLGGFLSDKINWTAAFVFYLLFVAGILIFAVYPAINKQSVQHALLMGALFGFFTYATYDLTNLATLKGWPLPIVIIDIAWGTILSATVAYSGFQLTKWIS
ncbi:DUF2177 family protein [Draconibacterium halophilum]|uniref:DUF2177 family protein n=1 Tax=Draconibacterium halophilum TaxID=2706887 RepID=A0A6C0R9U7_9BACT|nr:DUF2177 family protein [Draconibacterium halophilum]QIA06495.1 DUF2177 family protein [Draconibacterium halophilum]